MLPYKVLLHYMYTVENVILRCWVLQTFSQLTQWSHHILCERSSKMSMNFKLISYFILVLLTKHRSCNINIDLVWNCKHLRHKNIKSNNHNIGKRVENFELLIHLYTVKSKTKTNILELIHKELTWQLRFYIKGWWKNVFVLWRSWIFYSIQQH